MKGKVNDERLLKQKDGKGICVTLKRTTFQVGTIMMKDLTRRDKERFNRVRVGSPETGHQ